MTGLASKLSALTAENSELRALIEGRILHTDDAPTFERATFLKNRPEHVETDRAVDTII
jgi:hypothetical protein